MKIQSERFGNFEVDDTDALQFPEGIVGFPSERSFVLLRHREGSPIAWLQSSVTPALAFPVVSVDALALERPYSAAVRHSGDESNPHAVMAVLCAPAGQVATVNLLAPIVVNVTTRVGAQIFLEEGAYSTTERFALREHPVRPADAAVFASPAAAAP